MNGKENDAIVSGIVKVQVAILGCLQALAGCTRLSGCPTAWAPGTRVPGDPAVAAAEGGLDTLVGCLAASVVLPSVCLGEGDPCLDKNQTIYIA